MPPMNSEGPPLAPGAVWRGYRAGPPVVASAFMLLGALFFVLVCAGMALRPEVILSAGRSAAAAAALHSAILGWLVPVGFAVTYLTLPRLGAPGSGEGIGFKLHFFLHIVALFWILAGFLVWDLAGVAHAGAIMLAGLATGMALVAGRLEKTERLPMVQITLATSFLWLMLTMFLGMLAAANHYWYFLPLGTLKAVHAGLHAGFGGYLSLLLMGLSYVLFDVPVSGGGERRLWAFLLCNAGLYAAVLGLAFGLPLIIPGALAVAAGLIFYAVEVASGVAIRGARRDAWNHGYAAGFIVLFLLLGLGLFVGGLESLPEQSRGAVRGVYGYLWITLATGLPLWCIAGKIMAGIEAERGRGVGLAIMVYFIAAVVGALGIVFANEVVVRLGGLLMLAGGVGILLPIVPACARSAFGRGNERAGALPAAVDVGAP